MKALVEAGSTSQFRIELEEPMVSTDIRNPGCLNKNSKEDNKHLI
jgi:hypothetical protein